jgi:hypothetical protein
MVSSFGRETTIFAQLFDELEALAAILAGGAIREQALPSIRRTSMS